jgi:biopolymer transport protein ExbB
VSIPERGSGRRARARRTMTKKPIILIALLLFSFFLGSALTETALSQVGKPLTEETPPPQQPQTGTPPPPSAVTPVVVPATGLGDWFSRGGLAMWFILAACLAAAVFIVERTYTLTRARANTRALMTDVLNAVRRDGVPAGERICEQTKGPIAAIVHAGLREAGKGPEAVERAIQAAGAVEMSFLERGLIWLATISTAAPLIGFLGTVHGLRQVLLAVSAADHVSAKLITAGISEALIATEAGLIVAIPASLAHNIFLSLIDRFVVEMEESSSELVSAIGDKR